MRIPAVSVSRWAINSNGDAYRLDGYVGIGTDDPQGDLSFGDGTVFLSTDDGGNLVFTDVSGTNRVSDLLLGGGAPATGTSGWIYIENLAVSGGSVTNKIYQDTGNTVLQSVTASSLSVDITVRASYPLVEIDGNSATLTRDGSGGFYSGTVSVTLSGAGNVIAKVLTPDSEDGSTDTITISIDLPPTITSAVFTGGYPGIQTELKENDTFQLQVTSDKSFDRVVLAAYGASKAANIDVTPGLSATVSITAADQGDSAQLLATRLQVRDSVTAALSASYDTDTPGSVDGINVVNLNDLRPSGAVGAITYPATQSAVKNVESATVANTAINFDTIAYVDPTSLQISIANNTTFEASKSVTATSSSVFNNSTTNFRYTLDRVANASTTVVNGIVVIADVAPAIDITLPASRLRSGGNNGTSVQSHVVTLTSNQPLLSTPTMDADSGGNRGTFSGSFAGGSSVWTKSMTVSETLIDEKGTFTFESLVSTGLAGLQQTVINSGASYTLGGFVSRNLTFAAFATTTSIGTSVETFSKLSANIFTSTNQSALRQPIGTSPSVTNGYTIDAIATNPTSLIWLDTPASSANSGGTAQITNVEETV